MKVEHGWQGQRLTVAVRVLATTSRSGSPEAESIELSTSRAGHCAEVISVTGQFCGRNTSVDAEIMARRS